MSHWSAASAHLSEGRETEGATLCIEAVHSRSGDSSRHYSLQSPPPHSTRSASSRIESVWTSNRTTPGQRGSGVVKLVSSLPKKLMRGVRADVALRGFGMHWSSGDIAGGHVVPESLYGLSEEVLELNDFISHEWQTGRTAKFLALCMVYNLRMATAISFTIGIIIVLLNHSGAHGPEDGAASRPVNWYTVRQDVFFASTTACTFAFVFFFWQRLRSWALRRPIMLFVDKLCIHQADEKQKVAAIMALAGFLKHSQRLVILWTPRYFTRLWCTYEVASWMHLGRDIFDSVDLVPVSLAAFVLYTFALNFLLTALLFCLYHVFDGKMAALWGLLGLCFCQAVLVTRSIRHIMRDMQVVKEQLATFSVERANCYCCTHQHKDPATQAVLPCDRKMVYMTLARWYRACPGEPQSPVVAAVSSQACSSIISDSSEHLRAFDDDVRGRFAEAVGKKVGGASVNYFQALLPLLPFCWMKLETTFIIQGSNVRFVLEYLVTCYCAYPLWLVMNFHIAVQVNRVVKDPHFVLDWLVSMGTASIYTASFIMMQSAMASLLYDENWVPQAATSVLIILATFWTFRRSFPCIRRLGDAKLRSQVGFGCTLADSWEILEHALEDRRININKSLSAMTSRAQVLGKGKFRMRWNTEDSDPASLEQVSIDDRDLHVELSLNEAEEDLFSAHEGDPEWVMPTLPTREDDPEWVMPTMPTREDLGGADVLFKAGYCDDPPLAPGEPAEPVVRGVKQEPAFPIAPHFQLPKHVSAVRHP